MMTLILCLLFALNISSVMIFRVYFNVYAWIGKSSSHYDLKNLSGRKTLANATMKLLFIIVVIRQFHYVYLITCTSDNDGFSTIRKIVQ